LVGRDLNHHAAFDTAWWGDRVSADRRVVGPGETRSDEQVEQTLTPRRDS